MMILRYSPMRIPYRIVAVLMLLFGGSLSMVSNRVLAVDDEDYVSVQKTPIAVSADELVGDEGSKSAEFIGNVKVVRGEYTLTTDRLKVFFDAMEKTVNEKDVSRVNIKEIVAVGHVRILSRGLMASADRATYDRKTRTLVLTGENTEVHRNGSRIKGDQITIYIDSERVEVTGNSEDRVKGVFNLPAKIQ